ncbi:MAG: YihY/virulence factor BrkB family protein [Gemmatimonadaceae bacterium]|nr:YihY/virulence factor BrkB family protein [Gemmatimonadaceae bacterium]
MLILGYRPGLLFKKTIRETLDDNILGLSAQTAYNFLFSLFPLLLFLAPLLSLAGNKQAMMNALMARFSETLPPKAYELFAGVVKDVVFSKNAPGLMSVGALLAAYSGSNIFTTYMDALNVAYEVKDTRSWWKKKLIGLGMVISAGILLGIVTAILLAGNDIVSSAQKHYVIGDTVATIWTYLQYPIALALLILFLWASYLILPAVKQSKKQALAGAGFAGILFVVVTLGFRLYVQNFGSYNATYGTIGGVIVLLTWMYLASVVLLVGGELNSEIRAGTGSTASRVGAIYNGRIATGENPGYPSTQSD